jgi:hypothetical protein
MRQLLSQRFLCVLLRHKFSVLRFITNDITEFRCDRCGYEIAVNYELDIRVKLTDELKDMHTALSLELFRLEVQKEQFKRALCQN